MLEADDVAASQITKLLVHFYKKICTIILHLSYSIDIILTKYVLTSVSMDLLVRFRNNKYYYDASKYV